MGLHAMSELPQTLLYLLSVFLSSWAKVEGSDHGAWTHPS